MRLNSITRKIVEPRKKCPEHFQGRITMAGGINRYGNPNFKLVWAQTEIMWQGGHWNNDEGSFTGYRKVLKGDGLPHWMLLQFCEAGKSLDMPFFPAEGPISWRMNTICPETGLQVLGEFPYRGSYQIAMNLITKNFVNGELIIDVLPLTSKIINIMIPIIKTAKKVSLKSKIQAMKDEAEKIKEEERQMILDMRNDIKINPNKFLPWLEDKERKLEAAAGRLKPFAHQGFFQSNKPL